MLLHQFIVVLVATVKRFQAVLLSLPDTVRGIVARKFGGGSDLQET